MYPLLRDLSAVLNTYQIPLVWESAYETAEREYQTSLASYPARLEKAKQQKKAKLPEEPKRRMNEKDADNFLKLAAAMKLLLTRTVEVEYLDRAKELLEDYLTTLLEVCSSSHCSDHLNLTSILQEHPDLIKPNHHYILHLFEQILDYGPVYGFWTYVFERLNKILKSFEVNGHSAGELEVTFFREFSRETRLLNLVSKRRDLWVLS